MTGIEEAILLAGGQALLGEKLGTSQQNISHWKQRGFVPVRWVVQIEQLTGVTRQELVSPRLRSLVSLIEFD